MSFWTRFERRYKIIRNQKFDKVNFIKEFSEIPLSIIYALELIDENV